MSNRTKNELTGTSKADLDAYSKRKFKSVSNAKLVSSYNNKPSFKNDNQEYEFHRRVRESNGEIKWKFDYNTLVLLNDPQCPKKIRFDLNTGETINE